MLVSQEFLFDTAEVVIDLSIDETNTLALEIALLLQSMAQWVRLRCPRGGKIDIALGSSEKSTIVDNLATSHVRFQLDRHSAEYIQAVLLRAYRDKMAEVDHIHIDGRTIQDDAFDLTLMFQTYKPPMSPEEAARVMGD